MGSLPDDRKYRHVARLIHQEDGVLEIDDDARVSHCAEGAYVQAWVWVDETDVAEMIRL